MGEPSTALTEERAVLGLRLMSNFRPLRSFGFVQRPIGIEFPTVADFSMKKVCAVGTSSVRSP
jgi:hypothetical protein